MERCGRRLVAAVAVAMLTAVAAPIPAASAAVPAANIVAVMSPASDAVAASSEARALRREVASLLQRYIDQYRDRFSEDEVAQLQSYRSTADRQLATVVVTTNRLRNSITGDGSVAQVRANVAKAVTSWSRAKKTAETSWESARQIMEPRLSLFEKIGAANDYNAMMDRFDDLGDRIRELRPSNAD
jgi:hypothetical protein